MKEELKQIGLRLKGLRDAMELSQEEFAASCDIPLTDYIDYENGEKALSFSTIKKIALQYKIDVNTLIFDEEPRMTEYAITRKDKGLKIDRVEAYKYQALGSTFTNRKADIFIVNVAPKPEGEPIHLRQHPGQEFIFVMEGRLFFQINGKELILNEGDSMYFNPSLPHGMLAMDNKLVKFLTVIV